MITLLRFTTLSHVIPSEQNMKQTPLDLQWIRKIDKSFEDFGSRFQRHNRLFHKSHDVIV